MVRDMNNTTHTTATTCTGCDAGLCDEVFRFNRAKHVYETSRIGAPKAVAAERTMEKIVNHADKHGYLEALIKALHG